MQEGSNAAGPAREARKVTVTFDLTGHVPSGDGHESRVLCREGSEAWNRCGMDFNPSNNELVTVIKSLSAGLMQCLKGHRDFGKLSVNYDTERARCMATAMTHLEAAQMFAVKGLFTKAPNDKV